MYIDIKDLNKTIQGVPILKDINIKLQGGKVYGLKGKNGSGKTMLLRILCGLVAPTSGIIKINTKILGQDILYPGSVGALIETPSFLPNYSGLDNLVMLSYIQGRIDEEEAGWAMKRVGLDPEDKRLYRKYSLGMKQRLGVAAAIMELPEIVLLDEPINALDESGVKLVRKILRDFRRRGSVIVVACHDVAELSLLSDFIVSLDDGAITEVSKLDKTFDDLVAEEEADFLKGYEGYEIITIN